MYQKKTWVKFMFNRDIGRGFPNMTQNPDAKD